MRAAERERIVSALAGNKLPHVGEPATYYIGSDQYAAEVTRVSESGKTIWVALLGGAGREMKCMARTEGRWRVTGLRGSVALGRAETRLDPSF